MRSSSKDPKESHMEEKIDSCFTARNGKTMTKEWKLGTQNLGQNKEAFLNRQKVPK